MQPTQTLQTLEKEASTVARRYDDPAPADRRPENRRPARRQQDADSGSPIASASVPAEGVE